MSAATSGLPRLLTIMGSGETAPTMVKVHRLVVERLRGNGEPEPKSARGPAATKSTTTTRAKSTTTPSAEGILLDTPFGFQTNASEIAARAVAYFEESVGAVLEVAGLRTASDITGRHGHEVVAKTTRLPLVFAGPGSPSYALRQWKGTLVPSLLAEKLNLGGAVTFASAAALTLGVATVPVYEIYKVGEDPHWLEGLDMLASLGLPAVVIPHYDNAEGQTHDTRYCYLGEERLSRMESELPEGTFVLGVDEHTAICIDLAAQEAEVLGHGGVTVRVHGRSRRIEAGETVSVGQIVEIAGELSAQHVGSSAAETEGANGAGRGGLADRTESKAGFVAGTGDGSPLLHAIREYESEFRAAKERSDAHGMVAAVLSLEEEMWAWRADTLQSDEMDRGRASLRSMIKDLGELSEIGTRDPRELIGPYVELALSIRDGARSERRFEESDSVRDELELLGVAIHDTPDGSTWELIGAPKGDA